jgi:hypothetical protein
MAFDMMPQVAASPVYVVRIQKKRSYLYESMALDMMPVTVFDQGQK